jgi:hypothetical protein
MRADPLSSTEEAVRRGKGHAAYVGNGCASRSTMLKQSYASKYILISIIYVFTSIIYIVLHDGRY